MSVLISGSVPFNGRDANEISKKILNEELKLMGKNWKNTPKDGKDLIRLCLNRNIDERPSASECINHP